MSQNYEYFGKYILLEKLAAGGMAEVFLARAPSAAGIAKFVAIKRILPQYSEIQDFVDMFKTEAKIAVNLSHSNVVSIYEFGVERKQFFLVMDYVQGRNLRQILNKIKKSKDKFGIDQIVYVIKEVAAGLDHAHRCFDGTTGRPLNITHRDMSPQNIMVSFEGEIKIVDFGIAKAESQLETTRAGTLKGKFGYMSPEQADGQEVDLRTDIFSLGIVLWELLANDRLFISNNEINTLRKIRDCQVPSLRKINPNIPAELERIAMKCLARDRQLRYQNAAALHRDLNRFLNRQYPDFSPQDFAAFIKSPYADEINDTRRRLIEYAKIPLPSAQEQEPAAGPVTLASLKQSRPESFSTRTEIEIENKKPEMPAGRDKTVVTNTGFDLPDTDDSVSLGPATNSAIKTVALDPPVAVNKKSSVAAPNKTIVRPVARDRNEVDVEIPKMQTSYHTSIYVNRGRPKAKRRGMRISVTTVLFVAVLIAGAYGVGMKYFPKQMQPLQQRVQYAVNLMTQNMGQADKSSRAASPASTTPSLPNVKTVPVTAKPASIEDSYTSLVINSKPSGAEIFINDQATGKTTPSRVDVPAERPFDLVLKKDAYIPFIQKNLKMSELKKKTYNATLFRAMIGYLDIDVRPPRNARVYIEGKPIDETLPITSYEVPAGRDLTIRAINPYTGASAAMTISLQQDQKKAVVLTLERRGKTTFRKPSSR